MLLFWGGRRLRVGEALGLHPVRVPASFFLALVLATPGPARASGGGGTTTTVRWVFTSALGSGLVYADPTGAVVRRRTFEPFGKLIAQSGSESSARMFAGEYRNGVVGLYDYGARWYDAETGSFTAVDPIASVAQPTSHNAYAYVGGDPINWSDPTGMRPVKWNRSGGPACITCSRTVVYQSSSSGYWLQTQAVSTQYGVLGSSVQWIAGPLHVSFRIFGSGPGAVAIRMGGGPGGDARAERATSREDIMAAANLRYAAENGGIVGHSFEGRAAPGGLPSLPDGSVTLSGGEGPGALLSVDTNGNIVIAVGAAAGAFAGVSAEASATIFAVPGDPSSDSPVGWVTTGGAAVGRIAGTVAVDVSTRELRVSGAAGAPGGGAVIFTGPYIRMTAHEIFVRPRGMTAEEHRLGMLLTPGL